MKKFQFLLTAFFFFIASAFHLGAQNINKTKLQAHIAYLASDELEGRAPGTKGEELAIEYISTNFRNIGLKPAGTNEFRQQFDYKYNTNPHDTNAVNSVAKKGSNVIGFLDNGAANTIVVGGHFDHLGKGPHGSARDTGNGIHNGADDNASGTAGVLELARFFTNNGITEQNNFLFICFSAEEDGLVGSKHFTNTPTVEIGKINFMVNMDMIGRLNPDTRKLLVYGLGTSPQFSGIIDTNDTRFKFVLDSSGVGPTDHTSFYLKDIPVLNFFTGQHSDYHKETDDVDKINFDGEVDVLKFIAATILKLDNKGKLTFSATKQKQQETRAKYKVTLGIMPDYTADVTGLRIDAVLDGKPAQKAGIKDGDIIVAMDSNPIKDVYDYMNALAKYKSGESSVVKIKRGNESLEVKVTF